MRSKIRLAVLAVSLLSTLGPVAAATAASHHARIKPHVRAQVIERGFVYPQFSPDEVGDYPHRFCCS